MKEYSDMEGVDMVKFNFPIEAGILVRNQIRAWLDNRLRWHCVEFHVSEARGILSSTFFVYGKSSYEAYQKLQDEVRSKYGENDYEIAHV